MGKEELSEKWTEETVIWENYIEEMELGFTQQGVYRRNMNEVSVRSTYYNSLDTKINSIY